MKTIGYDFANEKFIIDYDGESQQVVIYIKDDDMGFSIQQHYHIGEIVRMVAHAIADRLREGYP